MCRYKIQISIFLLLLSFQSSGQMVLDYKDVLDPEKFNEFLKLEKQIPELNDSLALGELYYKLGKRSLRHSENLCLKYELKALAIFEDIQHDSLVNMVKGSLTYPLMTLGRYNQIEFNLLSAQKYWEEQNDTLWSSHTNLKLAYLERSRGNLDAAIKYALDAYQLFHQFRTIDELGNLYNDIIIIYNELGHCQSVVKYAKEFLDFPRDENAKRTYIKLVKSNTVYCLYELGQDSLAKLWKDETRDIYKRATSFKLKALNFQKIGSYKLDSLLFDEAKMNYDSALYYFTLFDKPKYLSDIYRSLSYYFDHTQQLDSALYYIDKSIFFALESSDILQLKDLYKAKSEIHFKLENYEGSIKELKKSDSLRNIIFSQEKLQNAKTVDLEFEERMNKQKIKMLEQQSILKVKNLEHEKNIRKMLIVILIAFSGFLFFIYRLYINKARYAAELSLKNNIISKSLHTNQTLMKEIHHRVKNNLQVVSSLLFLQSRYVKDKSAKGAISVGRSRVQAMSILHQKLYQKDDVQKVDIREYFLDLSQNLFDTYKMESSEITFKSDIDALSMDVDTVIPVGLITNELISNALKHAFTDEDQGEINLSIKQIGNEVELIVEDNGKGIPFNIIPERKDSFGMDLIQSFCEKLNAQLQIVNNRGTKFIIRFNPNVLKVAV